MRGNERIEQGTVLSYLPIQPHTTVTEEQVGEAYTSLFQSGLFADIHTLDGHAATER